MRGKTHIVEAVSVEVIGETGAAEDPVLEAETRRAPLEPRARVPMYAAGDWRETGVFDRADMIPGDTLDGPAIIIEPTSTTVVEPGWRAEITTRDHLVLTRVKPMEREHAVGRGVVAHPKQEPRDLRIQPEAARARRRAQRAAHDRRRSPAGSAAVRPAPRAHAAPAAAVGTGAALRSRLLPVRGVRAEQEQHL